MAPLLKANHAKKKKKVAKSQFPIPSFWKALKQPASSTTACMRSCCRATATLEANGASGFGAQGLRVRDVKPRPFNLKFVMVLKKCSCECMPVLDGEEVCLGDRLA